MVIGNGLRSSNIIESKMRDYNKHKVVAGYKGHKVLSNDTYKTSSVYGEKYIVISNQLYKHYQFYVAYLRNKICNTKSKHVFMAGSGLQKNMTQTNVASSLTSILKLTIFLKFFCLLHQKKMCDCNLCVQ